MLDTEVHISTMKKIKRIPLDIEELNQTECELVTAIEALGCPDRQIVTRVVRIVGNKFSFARDVIRAQQWLEAEGHIELED